MIGMKSSLLLALAVAAHNMSLAAMETDALRESKEIEARVAALAARYGLSVEEVCCSRTATATSTPSKRSWQGPWGTLMAKPTSRVWNFGRWHTCSRSTRS
mgnify:CR=1 FL=1